MYEVKRHNGTVIISSGDKAVFNAPEDAYVVYEKDGQNTVSQDKDLPDDQLLLALASAVFIKQ